MSVRVVADGLGSARSALSWASFASRRAVSTLSAASASRRAVASASSTAAVSSFPMRVRFSDALLLHLGTRVIKARRQRRVAIEQRSDRAPRGVYLPADRHHRFAALDLFY